MPYEQMNEQQVSAYLHMDLREVQKLASRGKLPCRKVGGRMQFSKGDIDHWVELRMHELDHWELARIERGVSRHHGFDETALLVWSLIPHNGLAVPLAAKTRDAAIRALADLADKAELVYNRDNLVMEIRNREDTCSTAMIPGVALPHPRHPLPYDIAESFVVVGLTPSGIPFGAADGSLTRLFFLICCKDDRTHLHVLARIAQILQQPGAITEMTFTDDAEALGDIILKYEQAALVKSGGGI